MLGRRIDDPFEVEEGGSEKGLSLLPVDTVLELEKVRTCFEGKVVKASGILAKMEGIDVEGYEIHMGRTLPFENIAEFTSNNTGYCCGNVYGTYVHGFFDRGQICRAVVEEIAKARGKTIDTGKVMDYAAFKEKQYDLLAMGLRKSLDMKYIYEVMEIKHDS